MCFETRANLNKLFAKWTIAVAPIAIGKSKKRLNTGSINVPNPKPEKKVKPAPNKTVIATITYSMIQKSKKYAVQFKFKDYFHIKNRI